MPPPRPALDASRISARTPFAADRLTSPLKKTYRYLSLVVWTGIGLTGVASSPMAWAYQVELHQAQQALEQGDNQAAYHQLQAIELDYSGTPTFDYWLGIAALRAGEPSHALIALDRAVLRQPNHAGARMERVAALLQLDQRGAAEREIAQLKALAPPPAAQAAIAQFEATLAQRRLAESRPTHQGRFGVDIGYDSNPQRFPNQIAIDPLQPDLRRIVDELLGMGLEPDDPSRFDERVFSRDASTFHQLQGSYQGTFPIDKQSQWQFSTLGQSQRYSEEAAQEYDLTLAQAKLAYQRTLAPKRVWTLHSNVLQGWSGREQSHLLARYGVGSELQQPLGVDSQLRWQLDIQDNHFSADNNDYTSGRVGAELTTPYQAFRTRLTAQLEHEWANSLRDGGDLLEVQLGGGVDYMLNDKQLLRADLSHRIRTYQEDGFAVYNDFSPTQRRDRLWQAQLSWLWQFGPDWLLMASIDAERRFSSFEFFDTHRYQTQLGLRYLF